MVAVMARSPATRPNAICPLHSINAISEIDETTERICLFQNFPALNISQPGSFSARSAEANYQRTGKGANLPPVAFYECVCVPVASRDRNACEPAGGAIGSRSWRGRQEAVRASLATPARLGPRRSARAQPRNWAPYPPVC